MRVTVLCLGVRAKDNSVEYMCERKGHLSPSETPEGQSCTNAEDILITLGIRFYTHFVKGRGTDRRAKSIPWGDNILEQ